MPLLGHKNRGAASDKEAEADNKSNKYARTSRAKREVDPQALVYQKRLDKLVKEKKTHSDPDILKALIDTLHALIPISEAQYAEYPTHLHAAAVNNLMSQMRESINDLRAVEDFSQRADKITDYVANQYRGVFQALVSDLLNLQKSLGMNAKGEAALKEFQNNQATRFNEAKRAVDTHVTKLLQIK